MNAPVDPPVMVVTGGTGALGSAICEHAEHRGALAIRTGRRGGPECLQHDVRDPTSWAALLDTVTERHGRVDAIVNAAGDLGGTPQDIMSASPAQWHELLDTHVIGSWLGCREVIRRQPEHDVSIVNLASTAGLLATPGMVAYGAMKAAVAHLTTSVALHCARAGLPIRCNAVAPALVDGGVRDDVLSTIAPDREEALARYLSRVPLHRLVRPGEVAETVYFLATDGGSSLTGQVLPIAGGLGLS